MTVFGDLPPLNAEALPADQHRYGDAEAYFDAYERVREPEDGE
jgi:hypothetical protein